MKQENQEQFTFMCKEQNYINTFTLSHNIIQKYLGHLHILQNITLVHDIRDFTPIRLMSKKWQIRVCGQIHLLHRETSVMFLGI